MFIPDIPFFIGFLSIIFFFYINEFIFVLPKWWRLATKMEVMQKVWLL